MFVCIDHQDGFFRFVFKIHVLLDVSVLHVGRDVELGILFDVPLVTCHQVLRDLRQKFVGQEMRTLAANVRPFFWDFRVSAQPSFQGPHVAITV